MQSLKVLLRKRGQEGSALPPAFPKLDQIGAKFKRSQISMIAAAPGVGKSAFALNFVRNSWYDEERQVPCLYFSPDSDLLMLSERVLAAIRNIPVSEAEKLIESEDPDSLNLINRAMESVWFSFAPGPSLRDLESEIYAYAHVYGEYPHLIILDNLKDVQNDGSEYERFNETIDFCHQLARQTTAHIQILHHVTGQYENGNVPVPFNGLVQKPGKSVRLVLTLFKVQPGVMGIRIVKSNNSRAEGDGSFGIDIPWLPERMYMRG